MWRRAHSFVHSATLIRFRGLPSSTRTPLPAHLSPQPQSGSMNGPVYRLFWPCRPYSRASMAAASRSRSRYGSPLTSIADEVVGVVQPVVLYVERMPPNQDPWAKITPLCRPRECRPGPDDVGAVADVDRLDLGDVRDIGIVDVTVARPSQLQAGRQQDLQRGPVIEGEGAVGPGRGEPQVDHLPLFVRPLGGQVVYFGPVGVGVVQLPGVVVEVAPAANRRVGGDRLPAVVPDRPRAEHRR